MLRLLQLPGCLRVALVAALGAQATPLVNIGMEAAFPAGPYLLELIETAAGENSTAYFPLLDRVAEGRFAEAKTDAELYNTFLQVLQDDGHITNADVLSTFNLALSLRSAAPRIEAQYQYYATAVEPRLGQADDETCQSWIQLNEEQYCEPTLQTPRRGSKLSSFKPLPFDRVLGPAASAKAAVLYADPLSSSFATYHQALSKAAHQGELSYRLRYRRDANAPSDLLPVSGYGVDLALKRTDYIVIDDREAGGAQEPLASQAVSLDETEEVADLKPLSSSELSDLGPKVASFILQSDSPFETLVKVLQDFPKLSNSIASHEVSENFVKEGEKNRGHMIPSGISYLWINGMQLIERQIQPFALIDLVRRERALLTGVRKLGFNGKEAVTLLGHQKVAASKADDDALRFDWTDEKEEGEAILWLNDLESDEMYSDFADGVQALLQRGYPGQLPAVARNMFSVVTPVDFTNPADLGDVAQMTSFIQRGIPIRFGLVPLTPTSEAADQAKLVYHLTKNYGVEALTMYLKEFFESGATTATESLYHGVVNNLEEKRGEAFKWNEIMASDTLSRKIELAKQWVKRLRAGSDVRPIFVNGLAHPREGNWMQPMSVAISNDLQTIQKNVFRGVIEDDTSIPGFFLEKAASSRNTYITPEDDASVRVIDVSQLYSEHAVLFGLVPVLEAAADASKESWATLTVVSDINTEAGAQLLLSALAFKRGNSGVRLDIVHNSATSAGAAALLGGLKSDTEKLSSLKTLEELRDVSGESTISEESYNRAVSGFLSRYNIAQGASILLLNGRVIGPIAPDTPFTENDFEQLLAFEQRARIVPVYQALEDLGMTDKLSSPMAAAKVSSIVALSTMSDLPEGIFESAAAFRTSMYEKWESTYTAIEVGNPETASVHIAGLLDPASEKAQKWAPVLKVISELDGVYLKLFMNPKEKLSELPVKRFYRYVMDSKPSFDEHGKVKALNATFKGLPSEALLTAGMDVPPAWLVAPKNSVHDLDNIKLSSIGRDVEAMYELEHILIEGHSREGGLGAPPKGAQLVLGTDKDPLVTDTIIMANLGFFQFKANPGVYDIHLKEGRTTEIFDIESVGALGYEAVPGDEGTDVTLMDFQGTTLYPRLNRRAGMENVDVLAEDDGSDDNIVSKGLKFAESLLGKGKSLSDEQHAEINIFSVASGHLYERMLNIMMVSVMKHTKHTVKFWFIEQFLSPSFKDTIPHLADEYGFKYEMVTYKWPHWLRQQKEKQREIWGYKILFLDVLFPLSLDKVIFVDADQIVRTDMIDLVNHDLEGAPYGFTPMCDSRTEMEGFRFWKQGYWNSFLRGKPYHISALYVVDLRRFRALAAGDRLRQQYHSLSADPNSLANLDQDLPNNMQFQIPIHSLPQEWLWCETWCSDESFSVAKTIDLCNNPQTKEPKLDRARRQVPEWTVYDDEIEAVVRKRRGLKVPEMVGGDKTKEGEKNSMSRKLEETGHSKDEL
ncbi:hypothetical protein NLU13_8333 [Sarocladium strictum]|uniref:UDP-glucose:glycoprotein glucosyltransferase n=1 Tax=Sarocladium strictum TaxID=5046 RepID=A0AA39L520_SARSR|nr:hypothetical protein NLU13_8333 [Sarocladium strictum]